MNPKSLKYILDIESIIAELELIKSRVNNNFNLFQDDFVIKRASERDLEIIGEAINKLVKLEPNINISGTKNIIGLRNLIIHSYDSVEDEIIWGIIQKDIPILKAEIEQLKK
jgi:uncharacterized protein with HEPN domain